MRIGLLDDDANLLSFLTAVLQMAGHTITSHMTSSSLLEALFSSSQSGGLQRYDLVILDPLYKGRWSGIDLFITIRKKLSAEQLSIILTMAADERSLKQWKQLLPENVLLLRKPFHPHELLQTIAQSEASRSKPY